MSQLHLMVWCSTNRCSDIGESFRQHALVRAPRLIGCTCEEMTISNVRGRSRQPKDQHEPRIFVYPYQPHGLQQLQLDGPSPPCCPDAKKKNVVTKLLHLWCLKSGSRLRMGYNSCAADVQISDSFRQLVLVRAPPMIDWKHVVRQLAMRFDGQFIMLYCHKR